MYIELPSVRMINRETPIEQAAFAARICYGSKGIIVDDFKKDNELCERLKTSGHFSPFRHATFYYIVPRIEYMKDDDLQMTAYELSKNIYCNVKISDAAAYFIVLNGQFVIEHEDVAKQLEPYRVHRVVFGQSELGKSMLRHTMCIRTSISVSRELNRVSPNNICEESTRYCNYNKDKFGGEITVIQPHWMNLFKFFDDMYIPEPLTTGKIAYNGKEIIWADKNDELHKYPLCEFPIQILREEYTEQAARSMLGWLRKEGLHYNDLLKKGLLPQDAREVLPLDTATTVVYTYSYKEWLNILQLRYYGKTGAPHPNAKLIAAMIKKELEDFGYDVDNDSKNL